MKDLTLEKIRAAFRVAQAHVNELQQRYLKVTSGLHAKNYRGEIVKVSDYCYLTATTGNFIAYATEEFNEVGTLGRNGRFYEKYDLWYKLRNMEHDLNMATKHRDAFLNVCKAAGISLNE